MLDMVATNIVREEHGGTASGSVFITTNWSMVLRAGRGDTSSHLAELCQAYWFPLYATLRHRGTSSHDSEDIIQGFFTWILTHDVIKRADRERGRFRVFLQVALKQYGAREHRKATAKKRRPPKPMLSLDLSSAEGRLAGSTICHLTPDRIFDHSWAMMMLERSMDRLREEYVNTGRQFRFEVLSPFMTDERNATRQQACEKLGMNESSFAMALLRLRQRFGKILYEEISRTVDDPQDVENEMMQIWATVAKS